MKRIVTTETNAIERSSTLSDTQSVVDTFGSMIEAVLQHSEDHSHLPPEDQTDKNKAEGSARK